MEKPLQWEELGRMGRQVPTGRQGQDWVLEDRRRHDHRGNASWQQTHYIWLLTEEEYGDFVGIKGHIGLQIHPGNELLIRFKDIEVSQR